MCGDVGFGKTEVAIRAIYRAVLSKKQVRWKLVLLYKREVRHLEFTEILQEVHCSIYRW